VTITICGSICFYMSIPRGTMINASKLMTLTQRKNTSEERESKSPRKQDQNVTRRQHGSYVLLKYHECPEWLQDNQYITSGYRSELSVSTCCKSLFHIHNETINIWTHLLAFLGFFILSYYTLAYHLDSPTYVDYIIFGIFLAGAQSQLDALLSCVPPLPLLLG